MVRWRHHKVFNLDSGIQSDFFASHVGVRQGENLSPLLFALFLNDLDTFFTKQKWDTLDYIDKLYSEVTITLVGC